jgi:hypothetical protein
MTDKESDTGRFYTNYRFEYPNENVVVATSSFQSVPSNKLPLINLTMNGILRHSEEKVYEIKMIFEGDIPEKDTLAQSYGTFVLCKGVYNARRIVKHRWNKETKTLKIFIDLRREKVRLKRPAQFSFSIQINDTNDDFSFPMCKNVPDVNQTNGTFKTRTFTAGTVNGACKYGSKYGNLCKGFCTTCAKPHEKCLANMGTCCYGYNCASVVMYEGNCRG